MVARLRGAWERLNGSYWFVPALLGFGAVLLSFGMLALDRYLGDERVAELGFVPYVRAEGARAVLTTVASSMITVGGVVFSLTLLVLTQASSQFGPRLLVNYMRDRTNQIVLGSFVATFVYSLLVLRVVTGGHSEVEVDGFVPQVSVLVALLMAFLTVALLVYFFHHIAQSVRVTHVLANVGRTLDRLLERLPVMSDGAAPDVDPAVTLAHVASDKGTFNARAGGYLEEVHVEGLVRLAVERDAVIRLLPMVGSFVMRGAPLAEVHPATATDAVGDELHDVLSLGEDRSLTQDPGFPFDEYVEIALRALSPSLNDPFTARSCIDRIGEGLLLLDGRTLAQRVLFDEAGVVRAVVPAPSKASLASRLFSVLRHAGAGDLMVARHLVVTLATLADTVTDPPLRRALEDELVATVDAASERLAERDHAPLRRLAERRRGGPSEP
jgi:uncharacterized membrane protein